MILIVLGLIGSFVALPLLPMEFSIPLSILGGYFAFLLFVMNCEGFIFSFGDFIERIKYPHIAEGRIIARMTPEQLRVYENEHYEFVLDDKMGTIVRLSGVEMDLRWISNHLDKCEGTFPDLPAIRRLPHGGIDYNKQAAFIDYCRDMKWVRKREGMTATWINNCSPETVREHWEL